MTLLLLLRPHGASVATPPPPVLAPFAWTDAGSTPSTLTARLAFTTVLCKSTGEPVDILDKLASRQLVQQLNLPSSYAITINMDDANYPFAVFEQAPRVKVYRPSTLAELAVDPLTVNQLVFYGSLPSEGIDEDSETGLAKLTFQEPSWVLNDRSVPASVTFTQIDQGAILWSVINTQNSRTNGDTWLRQGATTTGKLRDRTYDAGKEIAGLIDDMIKVDGGCDVSITPRDYWSIDGTRGMGLFNAHAQRGTTRPDALFISGPDLPANCSFHRTRAKTITSATSVGSADSQTYANATSPYGLLEAFETYSDVSISQTLLDKSVGKVANGQNAPMILEVKNPTRDAPVPILDYAVGDTVYATCKRGGMTFTSLPVRVHGIDMTISQNNYITTKPTLATLPETIVSPVLPPGGGGGGVPSDPPPVGSERVIAPSQSGGGANAVTQSDTTVLYTDGTASTSMTQGSPQSWAQGTANGLLIGTNYTIRAYVRGPSAAPAPAGTQFALWAGGNALHVGTTYGSSDDAHVWNAAQVTRETWTQISVTFTADATTMNCGFFADSTNAGAKTYTAHWTISAA